MSTNPSDFGKQIYPAIRVGFRNGRPVMVPICNGLRTDGKITLAWLEGFRKGRHVYSPDWCPDVVGDIRRAILLGFRKGRKVMAPLEPCCGPGGGSSQGPTSSSSQGPTGIPCGSCGDFPTTLHATLSRTGGGACGPCGFGTATLTYDATNNNWTGRLSGNCVGQPLTDICVTLYCSGGSGPCGGYQIGVNCVATGFPTCANTLVIPGFSCSAVVCSPLSITFANVTLGTGGGCCGGGVPLLQVVVTL